MAGAPDNLVDALGGLIDADGVVNERTWADEAPRKTNGQIGATYPYVVIHDAIALVPALKGDARTIRLDRTMQASLWERLDAENPDVAARLFRAIDGVAVTLANGHRVRFSVESAARLAEPDDNVVQRAVTIGARHDPAVA